MLVLKQAKVTFENLSCWARWSTSSHLTHRESINYDQIRVYFCNYVKQTFCSIFYCFQDGRFSTLRLLNIETMLCQDLVCLTILLHNSEMQHQADRRQILGPITQSVKKIQITWNISILKNLTTHVFCRQFSFIVGKGKNDSYAYLRYPQSMCFGDRFSPMHRNQSILQCNQSNTCFFFTHKEIQQSNQSNPTNPCPLWKPHNPYYFLAFSPLNLWRRTTKLFQWSK